MYVKPHRTCTFEKYEYVNVKYTFPLLFTTALERPYMCPDRARDQNVLIVVSQDVSVPSAFVNSLFVFLLTLFPRNFHKDKVYQGP
jgi:hypothetical protein